MTRKKSSRKKSIRRKTTRRRSVGKKASSRKKTRGGMSMLKKKSADRPSRKKTRRRKKMPSGFVQTSTGLIAPTDAIEPVPASKLRLGLAKLAKEVNHMLSEIAATDDFTVEAIELTASFSAKGEFLGFGAGGAASIMFRFAPV